MIKLLWILAVLVLALWSLVAWGMHALLTGSGDGLVALLAPWLTTDLWRQWIETTLGFTEQFALVALWVLWGLGTALVLAAAASLSVLLRLWRGGRGAAI